MVPLSGVRKPASVRSIVVLPQPEGPRKVMNSCSAMARSTPLSARKPPKRLSMPAMSMNAIALSPHRRLSRRYVQLEPDSQLTSAASVRTTAMVNTASAETTSSWPRSLRR